ncbi:hypothetical protein BAUCODRAFT_35678 [Baudoinia panamericana UAMH 10762]|uniref:Uncharacterized protein n=1 Tax=Baudoinia panamericana (strain UAMH 10762) TaxID=717646 RepID=M2MSH3_BAUPA|nr:uncharacterized protein BAUCODRAFT_35678 [Baudoinia panamericana UAMH 10762]EMC94458.1 hypothetical protein BAUCODRAFT_35678 [Baudoinia panamericana UAMH 10762]
MQNPEELVDFPSVLSVTIAALCAPEQTGERVPLHATQLYHPSSATQAPDIYVEMETASPPMTPTRQWSSPYETSPTNSFREHLRRRTSSFSSNRDRSPTTQRSKHRFSNASQYSYSNDIPTAGDEGSGGNELGNLADELDQLDDEEDYDDGPSEEAIERPRESEKEPRDSGIDVSYNSRKSSPLMRNFSKPFGSTDKPPDTITATDQQAAMEDRLSPDLEDAINSIARMTSYTSTSEDPLVPRTMALLQDLGNQAGLEASVQRLATSTNSMTSHLLAQAKGLQALSSNLYPPLLAFSASLNTEAVEEAIPSINNLLQDLPLPDSAPLQGLQKLSRETSNVIQTLGQLIDTLQMGKQITNSASRCLRTTQTMVVDLRLEREKADLARHELAKSNVEKRLRERTCAAECQDVMAGFEEVCDALRASLEQDI